MATFSHVHTTTDYFLFKPIGGNRNINQLHLSRLKKAMSKKYLFTVIIVNEKYEIIDGQHRFAIIKELGLPMHYIICHGYGLAEVHLLNENAKTWNADDYMHGYAELGYEDYVKYAEFKEKYKLGHNETAALLLNITSVGGRPDGFYEGLFKIVDIQEATRNIERILLIEPYYTGIRRRAFIKAMLFLFKNHYFEFSEFIQKLRIQPTALQDCVSREQYLVLIEEIYNYKRRNKINLRF